MLRNRLIPILLVHEGSLVKTRNFKNPIYIGDPINSSRIFNDLSADELTILDIGESKDEKPLSIDFNLIENLASECFMPLTYGGRIKSVSDAKKIIRIGVEKISINSAALANPRLISEMSNELGASSTVVSVDVRFNPLTKKFNVFDQRGRLNTHLDALEWMSQCVTLGAGEILLTDVDREGSWKGMRKELIRLASGVSEVPIILHGGVSSYSEAWTILENHNVDALGVGNLVCFQKKGCGVLVNYPDDRDDN
jgi:cyclase